MPVQSCYLLLSPIINNAYTRVRKQEHCSNTEITKIQSHIHLLLVNLFTYLHNA